MSRNAEARPPKEAGVVVRTLVILAAIFVLGQVMAAPWWLLPMIPALHGRWVPVIGLALAFDMGIIWLLDRPYR